MYTIANTSTRSWTTQKYLKLNLLPGVKVPGGYYTVEIQLFARDEHGDCHITNSSANMFDNNFSLEIESDTEEIHYIIRHHNSFPQRIPFNKVFRFKVHDLILLNLAAKLLGR